MYLPKNCRVITIGDGDLSFSRALLAHVPPNNLIATTYDSENVLRDKYTRNALDDLLNAGVIVEHSVDIKDIASVKRLPQHFADIVIFNHPLVPSQDRAVLPQKERNKRANLANRDLLYYFLKHSFAALLIPEGLRLCYITSKSVKPYSDWHIETSLTFNTPYQFLGNQAFNLSLFKHYMVRKVDRDKYLKHQESEVYVYSDKNSHPINSCLTTFSFSEDKCCPLCRIGPFTDADDYKNHLNTRLHKTQQHYHDMWSAHCNLN
ncbi:Rossmann-like fold-containing protein [uncultured Paraglaciecola sp.]|uniref:Rossmann-like fold-containing protein n=1 Tax=uncultured Paraglaciecola sp. TaxID=1765024 RepID=UPI0030DDBFA4|tara:strand:- start:4999 stop:5787 length:789 start_codon:yes stop_codon:yes gene_type:complete